MSTEDVRSRLWQDPFQAVEQHRNQYLSKKEEYLSSSFSGTVSQNEEKKSSFTISGTISQKMEGSTQETRDKPIAHSIEELHYRINKEVGESKSLHILAVMVPGGPYAEDQEWRLRSRYALISGMYAAGYVPKDPEHIGFVDFKNTGKDKSSDFPDYMPYEWFELDKELKITSNSTIIKGLGLSTPTDRKSSVLILWLNNDVFARNLNSLVTLSKIKQDIISNSKAMSFTIIGPHDSDTLRKMYVDISNLPPYHSSAYYLLKDSHIFSASATADNSQLEKVQTSAALYWSDVNWLKNKIIRTISTQDKLANTLFCELALRGVAPNSPQPNDFLEKECNLSGFILGRTETNHLVLIGESDTFYSQRLTESILKRSSEFGENSYQIHTINYLRGLDGITSKRTSTSQDNKNKESQTNKPNNQESKEQAERPTGTSQLDYLLRLAEQIKHLDKINTKDGGIKAIGITGSDPYDKLLIMQALRPKFPETLFFTTDLDARLFHPSEIKWTRNLIVASPFGLQLNDELQNHTPPFRDSYQTALYFTTLLALHCPNTKEQCSNSSLKESIEKLQINPRLFEIGNYGAVDLSHTFGKKIHPEPENASASKFPNEEEILEFICLIFFVIMLTLFSYYLLPKSLKLIIVGVCISAICLIFFYQAISALDGYGSESLSFTNGTSIWPANGIRIIASLLSLYFLYSIYKKLEDNKKEIKEKYIHIPSSISSGKSAETSKNLLPELYIDQWKIDSKDEPVPFKDLWSDYLELRTVNYCLVRIAFMLILYIALVILLIQTSFFDIPEIPFRGKTSLYIHHAILGLTVLLYLVLIFIIVDIKNLSSHFIKLLAGHDVIWSDNLVVTYKHKYNLPTEMVKNKILLDFINQHTDAINKFIYYPFFILFLIILSRTYYFDNWQITPLLLFIFVFTALISFSSAIRLRTAAQSARECILKKLDHASSNSVVNQAWYKRSYNPTELKSLIHEIKDLKDGVFQPLLLHPIVLSWFIPLSTIAGTYLLEYFAFSAS